ncbi:MAG: SPASM domain-containing protein [Chloroflexi bacterium]|nr:SPASM domain-containing protein [Chloroflexota bacterium]
MKKKNALIPERLFKRLALFEFPLRMLPNNPRTFFMLLKGGFSVFRSSPRAAMPISLSIESSGVCNLRCKMCSAPEMSRRKGVMKFSAFRQIFDEVRPLYLGLSAAGEPLLNRDLFDMISYAKAHGTVVNLVSNATRIDESTALALVESHLDVLKVSLDGATKETYEAIRIGACFEEVVRNVKGLIEMKRRLGASSPIISVNIVISRENVHEIRDIIAFCHSQFDCSVEFIPLFIHDKDAAEEALLVDLSTLGRHVAMGKKWAEEHGLWDTVANLDNLLYSVERMYRGTSEGPCFVPWLDMPITWDGNAYPCAHFMNVPLDFGNVLETSVAKVWNSPNYRKFRKSLADGKELYKQCLNCGMNDVGLYNLFSVFTRCFPPGRLISHRRYGDSQGQQQGWPGS